MNRQIIGILILFAIGLSSCVSYKQAVIDKSEIPESDIYFILHQKKQKWFMYDIDVRNDTVYGKVCSIIDWSLEVNSIHLYLRSDLEIPEEEHSHLDIPYDAIISAEVNEKDKRETLWVSLGIFGTYMISIGILLLLVVLL